MAVDLGMATAVEMAAEQAEAPEAAVQLALLPADEVPEDLGELRSALAGPRRRGRPAGAKNRKTEAWAKHILARYTSPLQFLAEMFNRPVEALAVQLGCTKYEAMQLQLRAASELAPYLHGKQPVGINVTGDLPMLVLGDPSMLAAQVAEAAGIVDLGEIVGNQWVGPEWDMPVGRVQSDECAETEAPCGFHAHEQLIEDQS